MRKLTFVFVSMLIAATASAQQIDLKALDKLAAKAKSKTEINLDEATIKAGAGLLNQKKVDEALGKKASKDMKGLFLRSYEFAQKGAYKPEDLKPVLDQLKGADWSAILKNTEDDEQTEIWLHKTNGQADGMLLIAMEANEVTVINAMGLTQLADLAVLGALGDAAKKESKEAEKPETKKDED